MAGENAKIKDDAKKPVTKAMLDEAVGAILEGMDHLLKDFRKQIHNRFDQVENRFTKVDVELNGVKDEINGLKAELSDTPSRREFEELKQKVERLHPTN